MNGGGSGAWGAHKNNTTQQRSNNSGMKKNGDISQPKSAECCESLSWLSVALCCCGNFCIFFLLFFFFALLKALQ